MTRTPTTPPMHALEDTAVPGAMTVELADQTDLIRWDNYVYNHPYSTIFHRYGWAEAIQNAMGHVPVYLMATVPAQRRVVGVLPLMLVKRHIFGRCLISTAFTTGGGVLVDNAQAGAMLLQKAIDIGHEFKVKYVETRNTMPMIDGWRFRSQHRANFFQDIPLDTDAHLQSIPRAKRTDVLAAIQLAKEGRIRVTFGHAENRFYALYACTRRNAGVPVFSRYFIRELKRVFANDFEICVAEEAGRPVASLVSFYHKDTVLPYFCSVNERGKQGGAYDFMYWSQMRRAVERKATQLLYGGTQKGDPDYLSQLAWGATPVHLEYQYKLIKTQEFPPFTLESQHLEWGARIWRHLPLPVANLAGPFFARYLA